MEELKRPNHPIKPREKVTFSLDLLNPKREISTGDAIKYFSKFGEPNTESIKFKEGTYNYDCSGLPYDPRNAEWKEFRYVECEVERKEFPEELRAYKEELKVYRAEMKVYREYEKKEKERKRLNKERLKKLKEVVAEFVESKKGEDDGDDFIYDLVKDALKRARF